jgi:uncharacterized membrane protein (UPF0136 family)
MFESIAVAVYAALLGVGGLIGYFQASSIASLMMGLSSAIALWFCSKAISKQNPQGYFWALILTAILAVFFIYRFALTGKIMPAGMMSLMSLGLFAALLKK